MFLEHWVAHPSRDLAATLRAGQIRRANPTLADAILQELSAQLSPMAGLAVRLCSHGRAGICPAIMLYASRVRRSFRAAEIRPANLCFTLCA